MLNLKLINQTLKLISYANSVDSLYPTKDSLKVFTENVIVLLNHTILQ